MSPLTVLLRDVPLQPQEALVDVDAGHVPLPDQTQHQVVREPGLRGLNLGQGRLQRLGGCNIAVLKLKDFDLCKA